MGLDTTHDCWHGAYSAFMRWRTKLAHAAGLPPLSLMEGFYEGTEEGALRAAVKGSLPEVTVLPYLPIKWEALRDDPLLSLLNHSDSDGEIAYQDCLPLADRLEELLPLLEGDGGGQLGDYQRTTRQFIRGLRLAALSHENVEFH